MKNNELKFLANLAKQRLMNKNYHEGMIHNKRSVSNYYIENARALKRLQAETNYITISDKEDSEFVEMVRKLIEEDCYNPLGMLSDAKYFNSLDESQKEFYILNLSEKYNRVKDELLCG